MEISAVNSIIAASVAPSPVKSPEAQAESRQLIRALKKLNESELLGNNHELTFVMDRETRRPLVRIINRETKEIVQQIPPEYVLRMAEELNSRR
ncbi:MAG: flagellar protein FlaG [Acidimicrobiia bacterium]|nr:flagellar protein FlaG [Acidimicrobiia bacterium]